MLLCGACVAIVTGAGLPFMSILQGQVSQAFIDEEVYQAGRSLFFITKMSPAPQGYDNDTNPYDEHEFKHRVMRVVYNYAFLAVGIFLAANIQVISRFQPSKASSGLLFPNCL